MAQVGIREYDAKQMRAQFQSTTYQGVLYQGQDDHDDEKLKHFTDLLRTAGVDRRVVKPDQLFGKRGKYGLLGINLTADEVVDWIKEKNGTTVTIGSSTGRLHTFLAEPLVPHEAEYYVSLETDRTVDKINFSVQGGMEIEEVWESVRVAAVSILPKAKSQKPQGDKASQHTNQRHLERTPRYEEEDERSMEMATEDTGYIEALLQDVPTAHQLLITQFITNLIAYARTHGLTYLEVNPFVIQDGQIYCLDMVAKADTCEAWKQGELWKDLAFVKPFGSSTHPLEAKIEALDAETGASLKFSTMNTQGRIGLLLGGGGASVIVMDKLADMGLIDEVINYGELSGNPGYGDNKAYIEGLVDLMLTNDHPKQYLCLMGGIANFTKIDVLCSAFVDALKPKIDQIKIKNIHCIIRRGGPADTKGLAIIGNFLTQHGIPHTIADGDEYLTKALESIEL